MQLQFSNNTLAMDLRGVVDALQRDYQINEINIGDLPTNPMRKIWEYLVYLHRVSPLLFWGTLVALMLTFMVVQVINARRAAENARKRAAQIAAEAEALRQQTRENKGEIAEIRRRQQENLSKLAAVAEAERLEKKRKERIEKLEGKTRPHNDGSSDFGGGSHLTGFSDEHYKPSRCTKKGGG